jgi:hypothetical protein
MKNLRLTRTSKKHLPFQVVDAVKRPVLDRTGDDNFCLGKFPMNGPLRSREGIVTLTGFIITEPGFIANKMHSN